MNADERRIYELKAGVLQAIAHPVEYQIEKITDVREMMKFGVMVTPALAVDGQVKVAGEVPEPDEFRKFLED